MPFGIVGFDPHDFSNHFLVENNVASGNGKHGFIFSRGCAGNVLRNNQAHDNVGHGFMIDDGRSQATDFAEARVDASNDNTITGSVRYGIDVQDPTNQLPVANNTISGSWGGISLCAPGSAVLTDNTLARDVNAPMVVDGVVDRQLTWLDKAVNVIRFNPLLLVWGVVVLFPLSMWVLRHLVPPRLRRRRAVPA